MRKLAAALCAIVLLGSLCGCNARQTYFGFRPSDFTVVREEDTHGGFLGDGTYLLVLDCAANREQAREKVGTWRELPLSEDLELMMYGGERNGTRYYGSHLEGFLPEIENGWYCFRDRHDKSTDSTDDSQLWGRGSFNFSLAVYDADTDWLYVIELDT